jgi:hypothetical protein
VPSPKRLVDRIGGPVDSATRGRRAWSRPSRWRPRSG